MQGSNWVDGAFGKALEFDGQDDYVLVNHNEFIDFHIRGFTISFWLHQTDKDVTTPWLSKRIYDAGTRGEGYEIHHDTQGMVRFVVADDITESSVEAPNSDFVTGDWVFVTAVRDRAANTLRLYANALLKASADDSTWNISHDSDLYIGSNAEQQHYHKGMLDEIRIYNYVLDSSEVRKLYNDYLTDVIDISSPVHYEIELNNYPNPFNPTTKIVYTVPDRNRVRLTIFNLLGQEVAQLLDEVKPAGEYICLFEAAHLNSGIYFYQLNVGDEVITRKMLLMR